MKTINVTFEDDEFEDLNEIKGQDNWREFILSIIRTKKKVSKDGTKE